MTYQLWGCAISSLLAVTSVLLQVVEQLLWYRHCMPPPSKSTATPRLPNPSPDALIQTWASASNHLGALSADEGRFSMYTDSGTSCTERAAGASPLKPSNLHRAVLPFSVAAAAVRAGNLFVLQRLWHYPLELVRADTGAVPNTLALCFRCRRLPKDEISTDLCRCLTSQV